MYYTAMNYSSNMHDSSSLSLSLSASTRPRPSESGAPPTSPGETELATHTLLIPPSYSVLVVSHIESAQ